MRHWFASLGRSLFGLYAWTVVVVLVLLATVAIAILPGLEARRRVARATGRGIFRLCAIPLVVRDADRLPDTSCVVIANHASYLDGIILTAALPPRFSFVIKREVTSVPIVHLLLRRLGSEFVTRSDRHKGASDARRLLRKAVSGESLAFFPEGSFQREPGIGRFRTGAFAAAQNGNLPVVPVTIAGSREILPAGGKLPRPGGRIEVAVHAPLTLTGTGREAMLDLKDRSRAVMLAASGEPDLYSHIGAG